MGSYVHPVSFCHLQWYSSQPDFSWPFFSEWRFADSTLDVSLFHLSKSYTPYGLQAKAPESHDAWKTTFLLGPGNFWGAPPLTYNPKMKVSKRIFLFKQVIFRFQPLLKFSTLSMLNLWSGNVFPTSNFFVVSWLHSSPTAGGWPAFSTGPQGKSDLPAHDASWYGRHGAWYVF